MVIDPESVGNLTQSLGKGIRNFEHELRDDSWPSRDDGDVPPLPKTAVRVAGIVLIVLALLAVTVE